MKYWIIIAVFFCFSNIQAQGLSLDKIRALYIEASFEEEKTNKLYEVTKNSLIKTDYKRFAYHAISILLKSKFTINPFDKIKTFKEGKEKLEKVINKYPHDIELRFLRFCVQNNTPKIINYKENMQEDSQLIKNNISKSSNELQQFILPIFKTLNDGRTSYSSR